MKISVKVKTRARETTVEKLPDNSFLVRVSEAPVEGRANQAVIRILAQYLKIAPSRLRILSGEKAKQKVVEIS